MMTRMKKEPQGMELKKTGKKKFKTRLNWKMNRISKLMMIFLCTRIKSKTEA